MVHNQHSRLYAASTEQLGMCLETLSAQQDLVWPHQTWVPVLLSDGLNIGSSGGHGPVRYYVEAHEPLRMVRFRFTGPAGFDGTHTFFVKPEGEDRARLTHVIAMKLHGPALLSWPIIFRPLHDALMEDALERVAQTVDPSAHQLRKHSIWVRVLRKLLTLMLRAKQH